jgi:Zn ribbon nucleic-acid-binding protein
MNIEIINDELAQVYEPTLCPECGAADSVKNWRTISSEVMACEYCDFREENLIGPYTPVVDHDLHKI